MGLVGPNGAGKTTLLHLAVGLLAPTAGTIEVLGGRPAASPAQLGRVGFVAQETPAYATLSVADHLRLGAWLNPGWDAEPRRAPHRSAWVSTSTRKPANSPAASGPSSPSPWPSPSVPSSYCWMSRSPVSTPWPGGSSSRVSWRSSPSMG